MYEAFRKDESGCEKVVVLIIFFVMMIYEFFILTVAYEFGPCSSTHRI